MTVLRLPLKLRRCIPLLMKATRPPIAFSLFVAALGAFLYLLTITKSMHGPAAAYWFILILAGMAAGLAALDAVTEPKVVGRLTYGVARFVWPALTILFLFEAYGIFLGCLDVMPPRQQSSCTPDCGGGCTMLVLERVFSAFLYGFVAVRAHSNTRKDTPLAERLETLKDCVRIAACGKLALTVVLYPIIFAAEPAFSQILRNEGLLGMMTDADACNADPYDAEPTFLVLLCAAGLSHLVCKQKLKMEFAVATWEKMSLFVDEDDGAGAVELSNARDSVVENSGASPVKGSVQQAELTDAEKRRRRRLCCGGTCGVLVLVIIIALVRIGSAGGKANNNDRCGIDTPGFDPLCLDIVHGWNYYAWTDENVMRGLVRATTPAAHASHVVAARYYAAHVEHVREQRPKHKLHWVFTGTGQLLAERGRWPNFYDLIELRMVALGQVLSAHERDDFRIEKDKCLLMEWMRNNRIPMAAFNGPWHKPDEIINAVSDGSAFSGLWKWPMFLKACHLTSASAGSVFMLKNQTDATAKAHKEVKDWIDKEWLYHADDWDRSWRDANNYLTDTFEMPRGFLAQQAANLSTHPVTHKKRVFELKLETVWGYPYVAWSDMCDGDCNIMRWPNGTVSVEYFPDSSKLLTHAAVPMKDDAWYRWVAEDPAYMTCAWELAKRVSKLMAIDEIRVDIFLTYGDPHNCAMNECSISSGVPYGSHYRYLAELWSEGHLQSPRTYQVLHTDKKVYELTPADVE